MPGSCSSYYSDMDEDEFVDCPADPGDDDECTRRVKVRYCSNG